MEDLEDILSKSDLKYFCYWKIEDLGNVFPLSDLKHFAVNLTEDLGNIFPLSDWSILPHRLNWRFRK